jgi:hypothetical protein
LGAQRRKGEETKGEEKQASLHDRSMVDGGR